MIAQVDSTFWRESVPPVLAIGQTRGVNERLHGIVELMVQPNQIFLRAIGSGCEARAIIPARASGRFRCVLGTNSLAMITRAAGAAITIDGDAKQLIFSSAGVRVCAVTASDEEFPPIKVANERQITLAQHDAEAWAVVDEPTADQMAQDTLWVGITPGMKRLYVSAGTNTWVAMVRDGQPSNAIPVSAKVMRKVKPQAGDIIGLCQNGLVLRRNMVEYALGRLADNCRIDTYQLAEKILANEIHAVQLFPEGVKDLRDALRVISMGSDETRLIPVVLRYEQGYLVVVGDSAMISGMTVVPATLVKGQEGWEIGIAGESVIATLSNIKNTTRIGVTDSASTGALIITQSGVVSVRAALRVAHAPVDKAVVRQLIQNHQNIPEAPEDHPEPPWDEPGVDPDHLPEPDLPEPE